MADDMLIVSGTSRPHVLALAEAAQQALKEAGAPMVSTEGEEEGQWVLVDGGDVIVHIFQPETREHYRLERLWSGDFDVDAHESDSESVRATEPDLVTNAS